MVWRGQPSQASPLAGLRASWQLIFSTSLCFQHLVKTTNSPVLCDRLPGLLLIPRCSATEGTRRSRCSSPLPGCLPKNDSDLKIMVGVFPDRTGLHLPQMSSALLTTLCLYGLMSFQDPGVGMETHGRSICRSSPDEAPSLLLPGREPARHFAHELLVFSGVKQGFIKMFSNGRAVLVCLVALIK